MTSDHPNNSDQPNVDPLNVDALNVDAGGLPDAGLLDGLLRDALRVEASRLEALRLELVRSKAGGFSTESAASSEPVSLEPASVEPVSLEPVESPVDRFAKSFGDEQQPTDALLLEDADLREFAACLAGAEVDASTAPEIPTALTAAALDAFDRSLVVAASASAASPRLQEDVPVDSTVASIPAATTPSLRVLRSRRSRMQPWLRRAAAALVVAGLGGLFVFGLGGRQVQAGLQFDTVQRLDMGQSVRTSPRIEHPGFLGLGSDVTAGLDELLAVGFDRDSLLVIGHGQKIRIVGGACRTTDDRSDLSAACLEAGDVRAVQQHASLETHPLIASLDAILQVRRGEARLATQGEALPVMVGTSGLFVLIEGAAHILVDAGVRSVEQGTRAVESGPGIEVPAIALAPNSRGFFVRTGQAPVDLSADTRTLLQPEGAAPFGEAAASLFRELRFFGGVVPRADNQRHVVARRWSVVTGRATRHGGAWRVEAGAATRFGWRVPPALAEARSLRVTIRGTAGADVSVPTLGLIAHLDPQAEDAEPGTATLTWDLPPGWWSRLEQETLPIRIESGASKSDIPTTGGAVWFEAATFVTPANRKAAR